MTGIGTIGLEQLRGSIRPAKLFEAALWIGALVCGSLLGVHGYNAHQAKVAAAQIQSPFGNQTDTPVNAAAPRGDTVIGRLEIAGLLSVPVLENYDPATLVRGVGHVPGTAVPGGLGNMVLAGHRDTFFRPLRRVHAGMIMQVVSPAGRFRYSIDSTEIVSPEQVEVTAIGNRPEMTLVTCYPFDFIGAAPKRFIVHAHLLSVDPA